MVEPSVAIILLNYNGYDYTNACIESLEHINYQNYIIIVVDNDSTDDSFEKLEKFRSDKIQVIKSDKNGGFAYGNNYGIKYALNIGFDFVLLLNNDTTVDPDFMKELIKCADIDPDIGIVTSRIMYGSSPDKIWYAGGDVDWKHVRAIHKGLNKSIENISTNDPEMVTFASGCCMLIPSKVIEDVGGLSEDYFMYYEDLDYCLKIIDSGKKIVYNPNAVVYHYVSCSSGGEDSPFSIEWLNRSRRFIKKKYKNRDINPLLFFFCCTCYEIKVLVKVLLSSNKIAKVKAYFASFRKV